MARDVDSRGHEALALEQGSFFFRQQAFGGIEGPESSKIPNHQHDEHAARLSGSGWTSSISCEELGSSSLRPGKDRFVVSDTNSRGHGLAATGNLARNPDAKLTLCTNNGVDLVSSNSTSTTSTRVGLRLFGVDVKAHGIIARPNGEEEEEDDNDNDAEEEDEAGREYSPNCREKQSLSNDHNNKRGFDDANSQTSSESSSKKCKSSMCNTNYNARNDSMR